MPRKQLFVEGLRAVVETAGFAVSMLLSAVTCKWGRRRGQESVTGRRRDEEGRGAGAGREAAAEPSRAGRTTTPGMPRAAPPGRAAGPRGSAVLVLDPVAVLRDCGVWSAGLGPFLRPPSIGMCQQITGCPNWEKNLRICSPHISNFNDEKTVFGGAVIYRRSYSWAGKEALRLPRQCSSLQQADFPIRFSFSSQLR